MPIHSSYKAITLVMSTMELSRNSEVFVGRAFKSKNICLNLMTRLILSFALLIAHGDLTPCFIVLQQNTRPHEFCDHGHTFITMVVQNTSISFKKSFLQFSSGSLCQLLLTGSTRPAYPHNVNRFFWFKIVLSSPCSPFP